MPTLIATLGGSDSNSYVATVGEADTLAAVLAQLAFYGVSTAAWDAATDAAKEYALVEAANAIDTLVYVGDRQFGTQARAFPRVRTANPLLHAVVPDCAKLAQVAEACAVLTAPTETEQAARDGVKSYRIGDRAATFADGAAGANRSGPCAAAKEILRRAGAVVGPVASVFVPRS